MALRPDTLLVWGAGQHGRVVAEIARAGGHSVMGYIDADPDKFGMVVDAAGARVVLSERELITLLRRYRGLPMPVDAIVPAVGDNHARLVHARLLGHLLAPPLVHPTAWISPSAILMGGTVICPMVVVNTNARVGLGVILNTGCVVGHDVTVEDGVHIGAHATLSGTVHVGCCAFVATAAAVIPGVHIDVGVVVGAGAVVLQDVGPGKTVVGVPAHEIGRKADGGLSEPDLSFATASVGS